jgi:L-fucose isomerase-like protein
VLFVDDLYGGSGEYLIALSEAKRKGQRVAGVASTRFEDVVEGIRAFECMKKIRSAVILDVTDRDPGKNAEAIREIFGAKVVQITGTEINEAYGKADRTEAQKAARRWMKEAKKIVEPSAEEIEKSGVMYVAMRDLMEKHGSRALTIDCLNLFYGGKLQAYPCLGLFQFLNEGKVGACEADLQSTITMVLMEYLTGRPGYISDPVVDQAKNQIIYAHCVAPNKVYGPNGPANPYHIRSHSEDRKGASVRSLLPVGEITTTLKYHPILKEVVIHQAKAVANIDEDKACRTKLAAEIRDVNKMVAEWDRHGWHRVTYFGDYQRPVETVSALLGFKVVEEG